MKRLVILAVMIGVGLLAGSAQADVITNTYDLGTSPSGTRIAQGGVASLFSWIVKGTLPPGSILRSVSANDLKLEANPGGSWASDLAVFVDPTPGTPGGPGGLLRIADDNDFGGAASEMNWHGQGQNDGPFSDTLIAGVDFPDTIDLHDAEVFLGNGYGDATWSGTVTVTYDAPGTATILTFGLPGNPAVIDWVTTNIAWKVPYGTAVTNLAPTYTMSSGATCDPASGSTNNFTTPQIYTVISGDTTVTNVYTVTVAVEPPGPGGVNGGVALWLTADTINTNDAVTQVRLSGSDVFIKQWNDQGDVGNNATNGTDGDQPQYIVGALNGLPVLRFVQDDDDNGDRLYLGDLSAQFPSAGSIFVVATINSDARYNLFGNRDNDERWVADSWHESHPGSFRGGRADGTFTEGSWPTTGSHVYALESSSAIFRMLIDGVQIGSDSADYNNGNGQNWTIGNRATSGQPLNGDIAELILFNRVLTAEEADMVGGYLADKYGLTTAYPPSTPQAKILTFGLGAVINQATTNITWFVPSGSDVSKLAPTFTLSAGATADPVSGSTNNFTTPQTYTIISSDTALTNVYTVTVTMLALPVTAGLACWYDAAVGVATNGSGVILTWDDQSGNAHHGAAAFNPVLATNQINSLPAAQFRANYLDLAGKFFAKEQYVVVRSPNEAWNNYGAFLGRTLGRASTYLLGNGDTGFWADQNPDSVSKDGTVLTVPFALAPITNYMIVKITVNDADTSAASNQIGRVDGYSCDMDIAEIIGFTNALSAGNEALVGSYLADKYGLTTAYPVTPQAKILTFGPGAVITVTNIAWTVPYGTAVTNLAPTFTMSSGATCDRSSGSTNNFSSPVKYTVTSSDSLLTNVYTVTVNLGPASTNKSILAFGPGAVITGTNIAWMVPYGTAVTNLAPTFTVSDFATCVPASGSTNNFSTPMKYTVTAQDSSTRDYRVTVTVAPPGPPVTDYARWFDAATLGLGNGAGVTQWNDGSVNAAHATVPGGNATPVYVADAGMETHLGAIYFAKNGGADDSAALRFTRDSSIRTVFSVFKGNSFLLTDNDAYHFHRSGDDSATDPLWGGAPSGNITGGSTYVNGTLVNGTSFNMPTDVHNGFNLVEVITTGNVQADSFNRDRGYHAGNQYQAEVIIYDRVLSEEERVQVEHYLMSKWFGVSYSPEAKMLTFGPYAAINQTTTNIAWTVPSGTDVTKLAPTYTLSTGATCDKASGSTNDFTSSVTYKVVSSDSAITNNYVVTVSIAALPVTAGLDCWFDAALGTTTDGSGVLTWADQSGNGHNATRSNGTMHVIAGAINGLPAVQFDGSAYAGMSGNQYSKVQFIVTKMNGGDWGAWMGSQSRGGYMYNPNGNCWDQNVPAAVSTNGTASAGYPFYLGDNRNSSYMILRIVGNDNNTSPRLYDLGRTEGWNSLNNFMAEIISYNTSLSEDDEDRVGGYLANKYGITTAYPPLTPSAIMKRFGPTANPAWINQTTHAVDWYVPYGTVVSSLSPVYKLVYGATCTKASGSTQNFSSPVTYSVVSSDSAITNDYVVTVHVLPDWPTMINVNYSGGLKGNMNGVYSYDFVARGSAASVAPSNYAGSTWNDFGSSTATSGSLLDSQGNGTSVGLTTSCDQGPWGDWIALGGARISHAVAADYTTYKPVFSLNGLDPDHKYDIYIASTHDNQNKPADWMVGATIKHLENDTGESVNWAQGKNFVCFSNLIPQVDGTMVVKAKGNGDSDGIVLNAFQVQDMGVRGVNPEAVFYSFSFTNTGSSVTTINGTNISVSMYIGTDVTALGPVFTTSAGATVKAAGTTVVSGDARNFTSPVRYSVTSEDNSTTTDYLVTVNLVQPSGHVNLNITPGVETGLAGPAAFTSLGKTWNSTPGAKSGSSLLDEDGISTTVGFNFNNFEGVDWWGGPSLTMLHGAVWWWSQNDSGEGLGVRTGEISGLNPGGKFDLYIASMWANNFSHGTFTVDGVSKDIDGEGASQSAWVEGANYVYFQNVTADVNGKIIITATATQKSGGNQPLMISGFQLVETANQAKIVTFTFPTYGSATIVGTNISLMVPYGTAVTALSPTYNLSPGATCSPASGSTHDFTSPVTYAVTNADFSITNVYLVTVTVLPDVPLLINVNFTGGANANMNGTAYDDATASGSASRVAPSIYLGSAWNDFGYLTGYNYSGSNLKNSISNTTAVGLMTIMNSGIWNDWNGLGGNRMLISGLGIGASDYAYLFKFTGLNTNRMYDLYIANLHNDGTDAGDYRIRTMTRHVENNPAGSTDWVEGTNFSHFANVIPAVDGTIMVEGKGSLIVNGFQLRDMGTRSSNPEALIYSFSLTGASPTITGTCINVALPVGTAVTNLAPTFTMSIGATCNHISGQAYDFSSPVHYVVTSEDTLTTTDYTVTVKFVAVPVARGLACWYHAGAGITEDGSGVSVWDDQSGNGHLATRGNGAPQLALNQINSLPAVQIRGGGSWFNCAGEMFTKEQYLVVRSPNTTWNGSGSFLGRKGTGNSGARSSSYNLYSGYTGFWDDQLASAVSKDGVVVSASKGTMPRGGFELVTITNYMILKITVNNGADEANRLVYPNYHIGMNDNLGSCDMDIAEIIGYTNSLSTADEKQVGAYLAAKYGIIASYPPLPPAGLTATIQGIGTVALNWLSSVGATSYNVKRSTTSGSGYVTLGTPSTTNFTDNTISLGRRYYYVVSSVNGYGTSANSAEVSAIAPAPGMIISIH